jgi:redox-sensitive bicupin YhaK (pirin superfamily)
MATTRKIVKVFKSKPTLEGAGVHLKRAFGFTETKLFDPFLLLDDFRGDSPEMYQKGFPWHPHRGIETITYVLRGKVAHGDSLGNAGVIGVGDVQWMTAGSGIIHQEMPSGDAEGKMYGFQLWANLPRKEKMIDPHYQGVVDSEIPRVKQENGVEIRVICGEVGGKRGPVENVTIQPEYLDVSVLPQGIFTHELPADHTALAYVFEGSGMFCDDLDPFDYDVEGANYFDTERKAQLGNTSLILFGPGEQVKVTTTDSSVRFLLFSGRPIHEPVAWYGPIVMNTASELRVAFDELEQGTFIKYGGSK